MNKFIMLILIVFILSNLLSQQILVNKQKLNQFINTVQYIQNQTQIKDTLINNQQKQLQLLNNNQNLLMVQIKSDSIYVEKLNKQIKKANERRWYQNPVIMSGIGYIAGTTITILISSALR